MKKKLVLMIIGLLSLSLVIAATSYSQACVTNKASLKIVSNPDALIGVDTIQNITLASDQDEEDENQDNEDQDNQGQDNNNQGNVAQARQAIIQAIVVQKCTTNNQPNNATGIVKIINRSAHDIVIKKIRCTLSEYSNSVGISIDPKEILSGAEGKALITVNGDLPHVSSLPFELKAEWNGGSAVIKFNVEVKRD